jgi:molybdopterin-containing oxidoreductase family membrane subunit
MMKEPAWRELTQDVHMAGANAGDILASLGPVRRSGRIVIAILAIIAVWGLVCWVYQLHDGLAVTAMTDYFSWGVYIINFVFFIGISMAGTLISSLLRLTGAQWRRPITRMAEGITLFALLVAGPMVIIDMGRPDRLWHVFVYGRLQSPILWDIASMTTYLVGSTLFLYLPMIPDMALLRDSNLPFPAWRRRVYRTMALGWQNTPQQHQRLERAMTVMSITIIPVAVSIHTVTAWIFGMTLRPGWHTSIIGPDFVVGALYSGIAAVITAMEVFRRFFRLDRYITPQHFKNLSLLLLAAGVSYLYFTINEYMGSEYANVHAESTLLASIFGGSYATQFWAMITIGMFIPLAMLVIPGTRNITGIVIASILVNIGMWLMRYVIVVPTLSATLVPMRSGAVLDYLPTWVEWSITAGGFAGFALLYVLFSRIFPIISIWELQPAPQGATHPQTGPGAEGAPA